MGARWDTITFGRTRRSRRMLRRLRELDRADARARAAGRDPLDDWHRARDPRLLPPTAAESRGGRTAGRLRSLLIVALVIAVPVGGLYFANRHEADRHRIGAPANYPAAGREEGGHPLGQPASPPPGAGGYAYERTEAGGGTPVRWDPCRPIHYVVSGVAPAGGSSMLTSALARISAVTGLRFIDDGGTTEPVSTSRRPYQRSRYGDRWAPVLIAWTTPRQVPRLDGDVIGLGGADLARTPDGRLTYVSGIVFLDAPQFGRDLAAVGRSPALARSERATQRAVILHELGHLIGLAHVTDPSQVMYPEASLKVTDFGSGDLRGLYNLATGPCSPKL